MSLKVSRECSTCEETMAISDLCDYDNVSGLYKDGVSDCPTACYPEKPKSHKRSITELPRVKSDI